MALAIMQLQRSVAQISAKIDALAESVRPPLPPPAASRARQLRCLMSSATPVARKMKAARAHRSTARLCGTTWVGRGAPRQ